MPSEDGTSSDVLNHHVLLALNCYLTASQAMELACRLLEKARLILDKEIEDAAVQMWNTGEDNEKLYLDLIRARKGGRRKRVRAAEA